MRLKARFCLMTAGMLLALLVLVPRAGAATAPLVWSAAPGQLTPAATSIDADTQANLLSNGGFESGSTSPWSTDNYGSGTGYPTLAIENNTTAHSGGYYAEVTAPEQNGSITQTVSYSLSADQSASFSMWIRAAAGQSLSGQTADLCVWALQTDSNSCQSITLTGQWQQAEASVTAPSPTSSILAQIYLPANVAVDVDDGSLSPDLLTDASFQQGASGWQLGDGANNVSPTGTQVDAPNGTVANSAHDGNYYERLTGTPTANNPGSLYQDMSLSLSGGQSLSASAWVRLDPSDTATDQSLNFCLFQDINPQLATCQTLTLTHQWQQMSVVAAMNGSATRIRTQFFLNQASESVDFDGVVMTSDLLNDGGFDEGGTSSSSGWGPLGGSASGVNVLNVTSPDAHDGSSYYETNTATNGGSIIQDVPVSLPALSSATLALWIRAAPNQVIGTENFAVCLWSLTPGPSQAACNNITPSAQWQEIQVTETMPAGATTTSLRAQIYETAGLTVDVDGAVIGAPQIGDAVYIPQITINPTVSGSTTPGSVLTCSQGTWAGTPDAPTAYSYAWLRNGTAIAGATGSTYTTTAADSGKQISCAVTGSNAAGASTATSASVGPITAASTPPSSGGGSGSGSGSGGGSSTAPTTRTASKRLTLDNVAVAFSATAPASCTAAKNTLTVKLTRAAVKSKLAATATVRSVAVYLGTGVKHTKKVRKTVKGKEKTVTVTTYTPNLTFTRLPGSGTIAFSGATSTPRAMHAVVAYTVSTKVRGHTRKVAKRATVRLSITTC